MYNNDNSDNEIETNSQVENLNNLLFNVNSDKEELESSEEFNLKDFYTEFIKKLQTGPLKNCFDSFQQYYEI